MKPLRLFLFLMSAAVSAQAATAIVKIEGTTPGSAVSGVLAATDTAKGLALSGAISGLTPGKHGFHVHEFGSCADEGKAAGSHYNPTGHEHGNALTQGNKNAHVGDMGNLVAGKDGVAKVDVVVPGLTLSGHPASAAGRAVIVHEKADDFGQPVGNAGGRVGCGAFVITGN